MLQCFVTGLRVIFFLTIVWPKMFFLQGLALVFLCCLQYTIMQERQASCTNLICIHVCEKHKMKTCNVIIIVAYNSQQMHTHIIVALILESSPKVIMQAFINKHILPTLQNSVMQCYIKEKESIHMKKIGTPRSLFQTKGQTYQKQNENFIHSYIT